MWKAIACDYDGTMTIGMGRLSVEVLTLIRESEEKGIPIILSSGRSFIELSVIQRLVGATGPLISENGGIVWNPKTNEKLTLADPEKALRAYEILTRSLGEIERFKPNLRETDVALHGNRAKELEPLIAREKVGVHFLETGYLTHIIDSNADKGKALGVAAEILGIKTDEIAAIGDSHNDVALFLVAGAGYAVNDADARLKAVAARTMSKPSGAGCAEAIRQILSER